MPIPVSHEGFPSLCNCLFVINTAFKIGLDDSLILSQYLTIFKIILQRIGLQLVWRDCLLSTFIVLIFVVLTLSFYLSQYVCNFFPCLNPTVVGNARVKPFCNCTLDLVLL